MSKTNKRVFSEDPDDGEALADYLAQQLDGADPATSPPASGDIATPPAPPPAQQQKPPQS